MPIIEDLEQRSAQWLIARLGCVTGSRVADVVAKVKNGKNADGTTKYKPSERRDSYMLEVVTERLAGLHLDHYVSPYMDDGIENEDAARDAYMAITGRFVDQVGLAYHPSIKWYCASPDGLVGKDGCVEIKCPKWSHHLDWIRTGDVPPEFIPQMKAVMSCAERQWCDFVSYCPKMPPNLQLFIRRLEWDRQMIEAQDAEVIKFLAETEALEKSMRGMKL